MPKYDPYELQATVAAGESAPTHSTAGLVVTGKDEVLVQFDQLDTVTSYVVRFYAIHDPETTTAGGLPDSSYGDADWPEISSLRRTLYEADAFWIYLGQKYHRFAVRVTALTGTSVRRTVKV